MSACEELAAGASAGVAPALRAVDCLANETAASAFGRLFGNGGAMAPALTVVLTLYIAIFALSLLTGRSRIGISALTPRMMTLGLVLTFATSWAAWQGVVWNLAIGAPDQLASVMTGVKGSATRLFADRLDMVFAVIGEAADAMGVAAAQSGTGQTVVPATAGAFTPPNLMWLAALLLLLGTVGVLVTARIALGVLLAVGPVFVVLALFSGTRGLFAGWLRGLVLTAVTPLFVVVGGSMMLELVAPVLRGLVVEGQINGYAAMALFLIASVHLALMGMVLKVLGAVVAGWRVFGFSKEASDSVRSITGPGTPPAAIVVPSATAASSRRTLALATTGSAPAASSEASSLSADRVTRHSRTAMAAAPYGPTLFPTAPRRANGIGSRFATRPHHSREMIR